MNDGPRPACDPEAEEQNPNRWRNCSQQFTRGHPGNPEAVMEMVPLVVKPMGPTIGRKLGLFFNRNPGC